MTSARKLLTLAAATVLCVLPAAAQQPQPSKRTLTGTVTDGHEPLHGAVVELQNPTNNSVETYLTDANGHYSFKRLDGNSDYRVWVVFRGHRSPVRSISKFDSHMQKSIDFTMKGY
jgi:hypothetical protein